jgi:hypothetical protein
MRRFLANSTKATYSKKRGCRGACPLAAQGAFTPTAKRAIIATKKFTLMR